MKSLETQNTTIIATTTLPTSSKPLTTNVDEPPETHTIPRKSPSLPKDPILHKSTSSPSSSLNQHFSPPEYSKIDQLPSNIIVTHFDTQENSENVQLEILTCTIISEPNSSISDSSSSPTASSDTISNTTPSSNDQAVATTNFNTPDMGVINSSSSDDVFTNEKHLLLINEKNNNGKDQEENGEISYGCPIISSIPIVLQDTVKSSSSSGEGENKAANERSKDKEWNSEGGGVVVFNEDGSISLDLSNDEMGFDRGLEAEEIIGATVQNEQIVFLMKWKRTNESDFG